MPATIDFEVVRDVSIDAGTVFDYVSNPLNDPEWCPLVAGISQIHGSGPQPGAIYRWDQVLGENQSAPMDVTLVTIERPRRLEWALENDMMGYRSTMSFESLDGGGTRITQHNRTTVKAAPEEAAAALQEQALGVCNQQMDNLEKVLS